MYSVLYCTDPEVMMIIYGIGGTAAITAFAGLFSRITNFGDVYESGMVVLPPLVTCPLVPLSAVQVAEKHTYYCTEYSTEYSVLRIYWRESQQHPDAARKLWSGAYTPPVRSTEDFWYNYR